jgi:hypothetical protein
MGCGMGRPESVLAAPAFQRTGQTHIVGKLTALIPAVRVDEKTKEGLERDAHSVGITMAELVREILIARYHDEGEMRTLLESRHRVVSRKFVDVPE